jgi:hypothetical protein
MQSLLHSRKFYLAVFGMIQALVLYYVHVPDVVWQSIAALVAVLIAGIAVEDAGTNAGVALSTLQPPPAPLVLPSLATASGEPVGPAATFDPLPVFVPSDPGVISPPGCPPPVPPSYDPSHSLDYPLPPAPPPDNPGPTA